MPGRSDVGSGVGSVVGGSVSAASGLLIREAVGAGFVSTGSPDTDADTARDVAAESRVVPKRRMQNTNTARSRAPNRIRIILLVAKQITFRERI